MTDEIKVGDIWIGKSTGSVKKVVFVGDKFVIYRDTEGLHEFVMTIEDFLSFHKKGKKKISVTRYYFTYTCSDDPRVSALFATFADAMNEIRRIARFGRVNNIGDIKTLTEEFEV